MDHDPVAVYGDLGFAAYVEARIEIQRELKSKNVVPTNRGSREYVKRAAEEHNRYHMYRMLREVADKAANDEDGTVTAAFVYPDASSTGVPPDIMEAYATVRGEIEAAIDRVHASVRLLLSSDVRIHVDYPDWCHEHVVRDLKMSMRGGATIHNGYVKVVE